MRVLVAGASGVLGRQLVPRLAASGHHVIGMARRPRASLFTTPNVEMVTADALNRAALTTVVQMAAPDAVVNLLTAIPARPNPRRLAKQFWLTNRLRTEGTRNLLAAATASGVQRVLAEGLAYAYDPDGSEPVDEFNDAYRGGGADVGVNDEVPVERVVPFASSATPLGVTPTPKPQLLRQKIAPRTSTDQLPCATRMVLALLAQGVRTIIPPAQGANCKPAAELATESRRANVPG